jgi:hypothetical protein
VTKKQLLDSSKQHIEDVNRALGFFIGKLIETGERHDPDKITDIDSFHADFLTGFKTHDWWDRHKKLNRHHLGDMEGIPPDVNLIDVLDFIADCVMSGMARSGSVYPLKIDISVLEAAFRNTVELLKTQVVVEGK